MQTCRKVVLPVLPLPVAVVAAVAVGCRAELGDLGLHPGTGPSA
jgi:hypothetical protein